MRSSLRRWLTWGVAGVLAGVLLGVAVGWWLWPVRSAGSSPAYLRRDFRDDYIVMVAAGFEADGDLEAAGDRLALLDPADPAAPAIELAGRLTQSGGGAQDIARLERLIAALAARPSRTRARTEER